MKALPSLVLVVIVAYSPHLTAKQIRSGTLKQAKN
jgi:hypothetical protein